MGKTGLLLCIALLASLVAAAPQGVPHSETLVHAGSPHALGCVPSDAEKSYILEVLSQLNDYRLANGLSVLTLDLTLERAVEAHCHHMAQHSFFDHFHSYANEPESQNPSLRSQANGGGSAGWENIAMGYTTPIAVMNGWKASPGHNANMLVSTHTRVGIGYYSTGNFWGQQFGTGAAVSPDTHAPTVVTPASATPNPATGTTTNPSVLGGDDGGELNLTYTWSVLSGPAGVSFSPNGTNAAKNSTATFSAVGSYTLRATIRDSIGLSAVSDVSVTVNATVTTIAVTPADVSVQTGGTQPFTAQAQDQFGQAMAASFGWSASGGGSIDGSGMFTAGGVPGGPFTVTATSGIVTGTADITVLAVPPAVTTIQVAPASATVPLSASAPFAAVAYDQVGNPLFNQPVSTWSTDGGTITPAGLFTSSGAPGNFTVTATSGSVSGTASVMVPEEEEEEWYKKCGALGLEALLLLALLAAARRKR